MNIPRVMAVFENTHATLKAERALKEAGLDIRTAIKPSAISAGCQMALTIPEASMGLAAQILTENARMRPPLFYKAGPGGEWEQIKEE